MRIFEEEQRFTQSWLIILLIITNVPVCIIIVKAFLDEKIELPHFLGIICIILAASGAIFIFKLKTRIDEKGIYYQFFPFHLKAKIITWSEIKSAHVRTYKPISEYGGWGLKGGFGGKNGKAINVKGNIGIQLELVNPKKLLIGTQKKMKAITILETYQHKLANN